MKAGGLEILGAITIGLVFFVCMLAIMYSEIKKSKIPVVSSRELLYDKVPLADQKGWIK